MFRCDVRVEFKIDATLFVKAKEERDDVTVDLMPDVKLPVVRRHGNRGCHDLVIANARQSPRCLSQTV